MKTLKTFIAEDWQNIDESYSFKRKTERQWQGVGFGTSSAEHELHHAGKPTGITLDGSSFGYAVRHNDKRVKKGHTFKDAKEKAVEYHKSLKEDWQKVNRQDKTDGLSQKAVDAYRRENPGSKLQTAVTEKKPSGKRAARRKSFCSRMKGMKARLTSAETARDPDSRINKALRRWNC